MSGSQKIIIKVVQEGKPILEKDFYELPVTIGRSSKSDIALEAFEFLSRQHFLVGLEENQVVVTDLNSANGIYLSTGERIKKCILENDLHLKIGVLDFFITLQKLEDSPPQPMEEDDELSIELSAELNNDLAMQIPANIPLQAQPNQQVTVKPTAKPANKKPTPAAPSSSSSDSSASSSVEKVSSQRSTPKTILPNFTAPPAYEMDLQQKVRVTSAASGTTLYLQASLYWKGVLYDTQNLTPDSKLNLGRDFASHLYMPTLGHSVDVAYFDGASTHCLILRNQECQLTRDNQTFSTYDLQTKNQLVQRPEGFMYKLQKHEELRLQMGHDLELLLKYVSRPPQFTKRKMIEPDEELKRTALVSGILHLFLIMIALFNQPNTKIPQIKGVPERVARLLVEPPRQLIEVKKPEIPKPTPPPQKVVKQQPEKKIKPIPQKIPHKVVVKESKALKQVNHLPMQVKPVAEPVNVEKVGALAALGAISNLPQPTDQPVSVNINKNAGGQAGPKTGGIIGALKTNSGQLVAGGSGSVKTKGMGFGTGTDFGVNGIKGSAGSRAVEGTVGTPQLAKFTQSEGLTSAQVMSVVKQHLSQIQQCYERSLFQNPDLKGRIEYDWEINPSGAVTEAHVRKSEMVGADALNNCVLSIFRKMKFPTAKNGEFTHPNIGFPFGRM